MVSILGHVMLILGSHVMSILEHVIHILLGYFITVMSLTGVYQGCMGFNSDVHVASPSLSGELGVSGTCSVQQ